jgi:LysM repeat protein
MTDESSSAHDGPVDVEPNLNSLPLAPNEALGPEEAQERFRFPVWGKIVAVATATLWRRAYDRQSVAAIVGRYSAHFAILMLALLVSLAGRISLTSIDVMGSAAPRSFSLQAAADPVVTPTPGTVDDGSYQMQRPKVVVRQANPLTTIPERVRLEVITYTVEPGDNIFWIAEKFKLSYTTIVWSNMEALQGAPWLIQPGLTLAIPPVDGAYHTVMEGDTLASIAERYKVSPETLDNQWNAIDAGESLAEGKLLVIPGGVGEDFELEPPPAQPTSPGVGAASGSWGYCGDTAVSGYGANGSFILPTGSYAVSGWVFADARNPRHIGLDYRCRLGDPIYAADAGVVVWAGWNGGYGNLVRVRHGNGYETYYAHFSAYAVSCGTPVRQGQVLGYCGSTGWSTGPHLHYEIRLNGVPQNPARFEP